MMDYPALKKIWNDPVWSKLIAEAIRYGAIGLVVLCLTGIGFLAHSARQSKIAEQNAVKSRRTEVLANMSIRAGEPHIVPEHKAFIDTQTGFTFSIDEIDHPHLWGLLPQFNGALGWYALPSGQKGDYHRYYVGERVPFEFGARKFFFVIADIDYKTSSATFRVDELLTTNSQAVSTVTDR